jgi:gliding motility-associated-like protein
LFVFSQELNNKVSPKYFGKTAKISKKSATSPFEFCDTDTDGIVSINLEELKNNVLDNHSSQMHVESGVYIGTSSGEIQLVTNLTTNPSKVKVCFLGNLGIAVFDIAYNQNGDLYVSYQSSIYKINKTNCTIDNTYTFNVIGNINSLSFDRQSNIYFGGSSTKVYRLDNGNYNQLNVWHDFENGYAAGDFVMFGDKMYIAWVLNGSYLLYEVIVDSNMNYVSHRSVGNLPNGTYGLASELGSLYGVAETKLFRIKLNSDSINNEVILNNDGLGGAWYGAAGKNEAVAFDVKVYETAVDAQNQVNALPANWNNTIPGRQTVYVVIKNTVNQQSETVPVTIKIEITPSYTNPKNIEHCESDTNASLFNINQTVSEIIGSQTNVTVSFHKSEIDAINNSNPLPSLYTISGKYQKVYFRVKNPSTSCFSVSSFDLIINQSPVFTIPKDISICNVFPLNFNLRTVESEIIGNQSNLKVAFYKSDLDALNNSNPIPDINTFTSNPNSIYFRVTNLLTGCFSVSHFNLAINEPPIFTMPKDISICERFPLNYNFKDLESGIIGNQSNLKVAFYKSDVDALNNSNSLSEIYTFTSNPNSIYFKVTNLSTGCFSNSSFNLVINQPPVFTIPKDISICDVFPLNFNLRAVELEIVGNQSNLKVTFYESEVDALNNTNSLPDICTFNNNPNSIYFRVTNVLTGCFSVSKFGFKTDLKVDFSNPKDILICQSPNLKYKLDDFDTKIEEILKGQETINMAGFYNSYDDAINKINEIIFPYYVEKKENEIFFRIENSLINSCFTVSSFFIYLKAEAQNANIPFSVKTSDWKSEKNEIEIVASGNYEYSMDGLTYQNIPFFKDLLPGEYQIFIRDKDNCSVISEKVFLMMYRNFFTPNGDGINDYWNIIASSGGTNVKIVIYDRYGKFIKNLKGDSIGWDGNYNNNPMPSSDYWFELITEQGKKLKGHFSLKR